MEEHLANAVLTHSTDKTNVKCLGKRILQRSFPGTGKHLINYMFSLCLSIVCLRLPNLPYVFQDRNTKFLTCHFSGINRLVKLLVNEGFFAV